MFIQRYLRGNIYRNKNYVLVVGKKKYYGDTVEQLLKNYSSKTTKKAKKEKD